MTQSFTQLSELFPCGRNEGGEGGGKGWEGGKGWAERRQGREGGFLLQSRELRTIVTGGAEGEEGVTQRGGEGPRC